MAILFSIAVGLVTGVIIFIVMLGIQLLKQAGITFKKAFNSLKKSLYLIGFLLLIFGCVIPGLFVLVITAGVNLIVFLTEPITITFYKKKR